MKKLTQGLIPAILLPAVMFIANPAVAGTMHGSEQGDLFLESVYEDYTLESVSSSQSVHQESEFSALETGQTTSDADLFLESEYEDYTISQ